MRQFIQRMAMLAFVVFDEGLGHRELLHHINKYIHRAAADHSLFAGFFSGKGEVMQRRPAGSNRLSRFCPNLRFNAPATNCAGYLSTLKEEHLGASSLWSRTQRVSHGR